MKRLKRTLCLCLALIMVLSMLPVQAMAAEDDNSVEQEAEPWVYIPGGDATEEDLSIKATPDVSSSDIVKVQVTATDKATRSFVPVADAEVSLYIGADYHSTVRTDSEGYAEVSLAGLSLVQRRNATISAKKVVSRGTGITGDDRDALFSHFPTDSSGDYYRYTMELHSETIDANGNWLGEQIPIGQESNKIDIVFAIDATGSMSNEITNVKNNLAAFSENLIDSGLDIRFSIIEYRDITCYGEETILHTVSGSPWMKDIDSVVSTLQSIRATGGGDTPETVVDALGYVTDDSIMKWRSDAYRFAFVLTDAGYKVNNDFGYTSMSELVNVLADMNVVTSVITSSSYHSTYNSLIEGTGGIYANINSSRFDQEMMELSDSIISSVTREMSLHLTEPRMLVNMAVCYFADDSTSQSAAYRTGVKNMLNEYANRLAETTDGHILLDKVILFSTDNRLDFYNTDELASMADIRIETEEKDDGKLWFNVKIHSNAHVGGFWTDATYQVNEDYLDSFSNLKNASNLLTRESFTRIQMSGVEGAGWNNSMLDDAQQYSTTVMHETGHYLLIFRDEYLNADGNQWSKRPAGKYGLMDNQHTDIEMSKAGIDYAYMTSGIESADRSLHTRHSWEYKGSCEDVMASILTEFDGDIFGGHADYSNTGDYVGVYTFVSGDKDRTVGYSYAALSDSDYITVDASATPTIDGAKAAIPSGKETSTAVAQTSFAGVDKGIAVTVTPKSGYAYSVFVKTGDSFSEVKFAEKSGKLVAEVPVEKGQLAELRLYGTKNGTSQYNTFFIDRSEDTSEGVLYASADGRVKAYVLTSVNASYNFIADNTVYTNGDYVSVNQATHISGTAGFSSGEIYSVAAFMAEIDYTTLTWFVLADGKWTALETTTKTEENKNIGALANMQGAGMYVLMAKKAPATGAKAATNLKYEQSALRDAFVTLRFTDPNTTSKYYNVYYSNSKFTDKNAEGVVVRSFHADSTELTLDLLQRGRTVYAAVEVVLENGARSGLSDIILIGGEADSDGDGIPDWYCDKYHLWGEDGEDKDIANSDDDGDGLSNMKEYKGGSDPTNPNDPVHTTNIPVDNVIVSKYKVTVSVGGTARITASVQPADATNKNLIFTSANESIATVSVSGNECRIKGVALGETKVYVVSADGGYSGEISVVVAKESVLRRFGADRYATSFAIADEMKANLGLTKFNAIVVSCGTNFPDALSGSYLAAVKNAPILLVRKQNVDQVNTYIRNNLAVGGTLYLLGGSNVVPDTVGKNISGITIKRLGGATRYETNLQILKEAGVGDKDILICTGKDFADSLSASAVNLPILLVKDSLTAAQKEFLKGTTGKLIIVGGKNAVSTQLEKQLKSFGTVERLGGADRYQTSVLVAKRFFENPDVLVIAYALNFPDGLCGGPLATSAGAPLILTTSGKYKTAEAYAKELGIKNGYVLGGAGLISDKVVKNIFSVKDGSIEIK